MNAQEMLRELPKGLLNWYSFSDKCRILYIGDEKDTVYELLLKKAEVVEAVKSDRSIDKAFISDRTATYDYIVALYQLEKAKDPVEALIGWQQMLKSTGTLLLGTDNRLGIRYFCGDRDPYTGRSFDGIENYRQIVSYGKAYIQGRNYSKAEIKGFLNRAGWKHYKSYSVLPNLEMPQVIYAQTMLPNEELGIRLFPKYNHPDSVFLDEKYVYSDLINNGMFHSMANTYLFECSQSKRFDNVEHVTISMDRGRENALMTLIRDTHTVEKKAVYPEGNQRLQQIVNNRTVLKSCNIKMVEGKLVNNTYIMPFVEAPMAIDYIRKLAFMDKEEFVRAIDRFREVILNSSNHVDSIEETNHQSVILEKGFIDLVPLNCFYVDGEYMFFDQEFYVENYPANAIIFRAIEIIYMQDAKIESILPKDFFWHRYNLQNDVELWRKKSGEFTQKLRNQKQLKPFLEQHEINHQTVHTNRQRMNYSKDEYQKIFVNIFKGIQNQKIILFGSGNFTKRFLSLYGEDYAIAFIVDNNPAQWGKKLNGIEICSPERLVNLNLEAYRIIICIKAFLPIVHQLKAMQIDTYYVYDRNIEYKHSQAPKMIVSKDEDQTIKKYNVGYIAGVFDLFHIGHLNLLKRAKEQCNYLIVGVVSDEGVKRNKKVEPYIPFEERIEIVRSCRYVDRAVEIPLDFAGSREAYEKYQFDCQFSGSDYTQDPDWKANQLFLEKKGATLVFLPYTEQTSSTKIKKAIQSRDEKNNLD